MKNLLYVLTLILVLNGISLQAQTPNYKHGVSYSFIAIDHFGPFQEAFSFGEENLTNGAMISYHRSLNSKFLNLEVPLRIGGVNFFNTGTRNQNDGFLGLDALLQLHYTKADGSNRVIPYLSAGLGAMILDKNGFNGEVPAGVGLDIKLGTQFYLKLRSEYRFGFEEDRDNWNHIVGLKAIFGEGAKEEEPIEIVPTDTDGDGISDAQDKCPTIAGLAAFQGCPDTDGDGVADADDACPEVAGLSKFGGCPDTDNDGVTDAKDNCPKEAGPASNNGCPLADADGDGVTDDVDECPNAPGSSATNGCPDSDNDGIVDKNDDCPNQAGSSATRGCPDADSDGVADSKDKCPNKAGPIKNQGCPELEEKEKEVLSFAAQAIQFNTSSARIKTESYDILDQVAAILIKYPDYKCSISGHTDSQGNADGNKRLSEKRAKACYDYLISKGVSATRLSYAGYGEEQPIADNKYEAGRKKNRRVEFNIYL